MPIRAMSDKILRFRRPAHDLSDEALVLACGASDGQALEELFHRHGAQVHRVLARLGHINREDLDDVVQTTFLEVYRSANRFNRRSAVSTWILGVAMNVARHHARGEARRRSAMSAVARVSPSADRRGPDEWASQRQSLERMQIAFDALPYDFRIVFTLCDLEGVKGTEVARALGVPEGTVWRRLHEARIRLRAHIDKEPPR
jgi:RNA polymerase sigma factor (sigma-70 family)